MTQENKELLLKDLGARMPYGVKASYYGPYEECETWDEIDGITIDGHVDIGQYSLPIEGIKPYLLPLSSMTEEQLDELKEYSGLKDSESLLELVSWTDTHSTLEFWLEEVPSYIVIKVFDWLDKNHFDYRCLIEEGLAIDCTDLNIY